MKTMKRLIYVAAGMLILVSEASSQINPLPPASVRVHDMTLNLRTVDALVSLARKYHVVIGMYGTLIGTEDQNIDISVQEGTLADVFDAIVKADSKLEWKQGAKGASKLEWQQASNGAIHFVTPDIPLGLLAVVVHSYDADNPGRLLTPDLLAQIPEVSRWLRSHGCRMGELVLGRGPKEWGRFAVHAKDTPFSAVLDEIAAKSGTYFWSVIQHRTEPCLIQIEF
jgi:hypothetical protein